MKNRLIQFINFGISFNQKSCFSNFSANIYHGNKIGIIGNNGSGKSSTLKTMAGINSQYEGKLIIEPNITIAYIPQIITDHHDKSGGQRFHAELNNALAANPDVLLLDEPTNHLDMRNKESLMRMLERFNGTLIIISHDPILLARCVDSIWHIHDQAVEIFSGNYTDFLNEQRNAATKLEKTIQALEKQATKAKINQQKEHQRAASSRRTNINEPDTLLKRKMQETAAKTTGKKQSSIKKIQEEIAHNKSELKIAKIIKPNFCLDSGTIYEKTIISIANGSCGFNDKPILNNISLTVGSKERIAIYGDNGSGKTTFIKALMNDPTITKAGDWHIPQSLSIGYLDQHYHILDRTLTPFEIIGKAAPSWTKEQIQKLLVSFLFIKPEEQHALVAHLSGGELARLSLAIIATKTPQLLILDEITNNIDLETRAHVIEVIKEYPGALLVISHDQEFLNAIKITTSYLCKNSLFMYHT